MPSKVNFPPDHDPRVSSLYALNDIDINAPPEVVWKLLVDATNWSGYFPPENQITILGGETELAQGTRYTRVTVGHVMRCVVTECDPLHRLSWSTTVDGDTTGSSAYHGWVITPTAEGCYLSTEETLQGEFFLDLIGRKSPGALYKYHQDWVELLARAAEAKAAR
ncbi:SRPBCC domain-containing protein [Fertoebacter nigrum]|uniref:SRPBCC domain-containing protein n=1 Tax=Fertoeibacter niger TaxID=2656921 RepID=A0A8X8KSG6_9RHOB|nr:SRPBCC domain-containing protein [Fertoeibacter niger]NUB46462.1 SRPBCC domain-containing protein [Fertoeibacter niger]